MALLVGCCMSSRWLRAEGKRLRRADRKMKDRKMGDRKMKNFSSCLSFPVFHFPVFHFPVFHFPVFHFPVSHFPVFHFPVGHILLTAASGRLGLLLRSNRAPAHLDYRFGDLAF